MNHKRTLIIVALVILTLAFATSVSAQENYDTQAILESGPVFNVAVTLGEFSFAPNPQDKNSILISNAAGLSNAPWSVGGRVLGVVTNSGSAVAVVTQTGVYTYSTEGGRFGPTNNSINIVDSRIRLYGHVEGACFISFPHDSLPTLVTLQAGVGQYGFSFSDGCTSQTLPEGSIENWLKLTAAAYGIAPTAMSNLGPVSLLVAVSEEPAALECEEIEEAALRNAAVMLTEEAPAVCFYHGGDRYIAGFYSGQYTIKGLNPDGTETGESWTIGTQAGGGNAMNGAPAQLFVINGSIYLSALPAN